MKKYYDFILTSGFQKRGIHLFMGFVSFCIQITTRNFTNIVAGQIILIIT